MKKKLKVLLVFDTPNSFERGYDFQEEFKDPDWVTEKDVYKALLENGYGVGLLGLHNNIAFLIDEIKEKKPDVVFNLTEVFNNRSHLDKNVAWILEMLGVRYTGASPTSLLICNNKALSKKILTYHKIKVPNFYLFYREHKIWLPKRLKVPLIVKPVSEEASRGISQASVVDSEEALIERVKFIHEKIRDDAIVEEYIDGRELYVGVFGPKRITVLPPIEMVFENVPEDEPRIATYKAKWDKNYRKKWGIRNVSAGRLSDEILNKVRTICKRAYKALNMNCYVRFDIRVTADLTVYILEVNANPCLAKDEDFAQSAAKANIPYDALIKKIIKIARR